MRRDSIEAIFSKFSELNPFPKTELLYSNNFTLAVAVILSAQATDVSVNKVTAELFKTFDTPEKLVSLGEEGLKTYIRSIGLFNSKAKNIIALCRILIKDHNSQIPEDFDALINLPGIGRKTANVILSCAFGHDTIAVDTHVFRVAKRIGLSSASTPQKVEKDLINNIPKEYLRHAHHWLILHGRYVCKARKPLCDICHVKDHCNTTQLGLRGRQ